MSNKTLAERLRTIAAWVEVQQSPEAAEDIEAVADALDAKDDRIKQLEAALRKIADQDVPFYDGYQPNVCIHRRTSDQDCPLCTAKYARDVLAADDEAKP